MSGTARRAKELAESFVKRGHSVNIITSFPREFRSLPGEKFSSKEKICGVNVFRVKNLFQVKKNPIFRMISYFIFVLFSIRLGLKLAKKSKIIISIAPLSSGILGAIIKIISKKHHHFDVPDILPDLGIAAGMLKNKLLIFLLRKLEVWVYNNSNTISTCTEGQKRNINEKGISLNKLSCIPDWVDDSFFTNNYAKYKNEVLNKYNFQNKKIISFFGNIGALQNPIVFFEIMKIFKEEGFDDFHFLFVGDGIMLPQIKRICSENKLKNIEFIGRVQREYIPVLMKISNVLVTNYVPDNHLDLYIPGKLFEYAISEKPIVMGSRGDSKEFIEKYNLGKAVPPSNPDSFVKAILEVTDKSYDFSPKSSEFKHDYSLNNVAILYDNILNQLD